MMENLAAYKQSEAARQEMEEESRLIIENSPYCIHQIDKEARIISMNPAGIKMMEASDEREILGMSYVDTVSKKDKDQVKDLLYAALSGKASEFEFLANNKHIFSSLFVPIFNNHGEVVRLLGITHDITERVQVEQNLQRSELRFRSLVEQSPFGICVFDADGTMIEMNNAAQVIGNISDEVKAGLIGQFNICTSKQARKQLSFGEEIDRAFTGEVISTLPYKIHVKKILAEIGINEKNLTDKWIISHFYPIKDANDKLINVVVFFEDVTKRKLREEKHVQQERLAAVGQLAAGIAHDFNNVMAVITLYSGLLQDSSNLSSKELQKLKIINQQAHHAADLTRQILDFSRKSILELRPLDLKLLLNEIMKFVNRTIPERIKIQFTFSEGDYMINGDPTQLQQVITNLTINARDALPHGGTLLFNLSHLRLLADETPPDADMEPGAWVILTVTDNGIGIAPETLPNIFEPFFTTKEVGKGSGLGLAQVYGIMQQHEGCITVESQLGKGTTFTIYLPALMMETAVKSVEPLSTIPQGVGETILLVEDNQSVLEAIRSILESLNYRVITAENGQEALSVYRIQPDQISLILSDVVMPKMNGFEMAKALQQESPPPKLFLMSGFPRDKKIASEIQPFVSGWLSKPLNLRQLAEALREALD
jgi:PAS domain S-box-containing protein